MVNAYVCSNKATRSLGACQSARVLEHPSGLLPTKAAMSTDASRGLETDPNDADRTDTELEARTRRALEQYLTVLPETDPVDELGAVADVPGMVLVVSESGSEYVVDVDAGRCECPDARHRDVMCKHVRRAAFATGEEAIPADAAAALDVDPELGHHTDASLRFAAADGGIVEAGDDAEVLDGGPTYSYHHEPPEQGGARYVRCDECGAESVPADPERVLHRPGCSGATRRD